MPVQKKRATSLISQNELDELLQIAELIEERDEAKLSLVDEIKNAILNSGKLSLIEWRRLRSNLAEIEALIPTIEMIIKLKQEEESSARLKEAREARGVK